MRQFIIISPLSVRYIFLMKQFEEQKPSDEKHKQSIWFVFFKYRWLNYSDECINNVRWQNERKRKSGYVLFHSIKVHRPPISTSIYYLKLDRIQSANELGSEYNYSKNWSWNWKIRSHKNIPVVFNQSINLYAKYNCRPAGRHIHIDRK